jgi:transcriptional regulator with XRE-family HTH domain
MAQKGGKHEGSGKAKPKPPRHPRELMYRAAVARLVTELRMEAGEMTQQKLAEKSGYTPQYISDLEQRKYTPTIAAFGEIVRGLGIIAPNQAWERLSELLHQFAHLEVKMDEAVAAIDEDASTDTDREVRRRIQAMLRKCTGNRLLQAYDSLMPIAETEP